MKTSKEIMADLDRRTAIEIMRTFKSLYNKAGYPIGADFNNLLAAAFREHGNPIETPHSNVANALVGLLEKKSKISFFSEV